MIHRLVECAKTISGTRSFHRFRPTNSSALEIMRTSGQESVSLRYYFEISEWKELHPLSIGFIHHFGGGDYSR